MRDKLYIKAVEIENTYNFVVDNCFRWIHLLHEKYVKPFRFQNSIFQMTSDREKT
jgi:hypothetical protein